MIRCECCDMELNTPNELLARLCKEHLRLIRAKGTYVGVCWECGKITLIEEIPRHLRFVFKDKYLFTNACSRCSGKSENDVAWITFSRFQPNHFFVINDKGKIEKVVNQPEKPKDRNPVRSTAETELHSRDYDKVEVQYE